MNNVLLLANGIFLLAYLALQQLIVNGPLREAYERRSLCFELDAFYRLMSSFDSVWMMIGASLVVPAAFYFLSKTSTKRTAVALAVINPLLFGFVWSMNYGTPHAWNMAETFGIRSIVISLTSNLPERNGGMAGRIASF